MNKTVKNKLSSLWALIIKFALKLVTFILKLTKSAKVLKIALGAASLGSWALLYNWKFALLIVGSISWHEWGHVNAMRKLNMPTKGFYLLPFLGGVAIGEGSYKEYMDNVFVAILGPVFGLILSFATYLAWYFTGIPLLAAAASWMALVNIFNLLPVSKLDGGQVFRAIAVSVGGLRAKVAMIVSFLLGMVATIYLKSGLLALIMFLGMFDLLPYLWPKTFHSSRFLPENMPVLMTGKRCWFSFGIYALTCAALGVIMLKTGHVPGADIASNFFKD